MENYAEGEKGEQQKQRDKAREQALASLSDRVDPETHKVKIWHLQDGYIEREPVDAAEMIANGSAVLDKPAENEQDAEV